jgi:Domain of unknown function (DUF5615)
MSLSFYMDEHVPKEITNGLRIRGIDVLTVQGDDHTGISDALVLDRATELQRILGITDLRYESPSSPNPFSQIWEKGDRSLTPLARHRERGWG